jgi:hypothetical protein
MTTIMSPLHDVDEGRDDYDNYDSNSKFNKTKMMTPQKTNLAILTMKMMIPWSVLLMPCHNNKKKARVTLDKCLPTTRVLQKIPTTMHCILTIRDTLQTTVTVTVIMSLLLPIPLMTTMKPTIRASLKQGELAIRASLNQGELLLVEHDAVTFLHQKSGAALEHKTVNVKLVMSDMYAAATLTSLKDGNNSYTHLALESLLSVLYNSGRPLMLFL